MVREVNVMKKLSEIFDFDGKCGCGICQEGCSPCEVEMIKDWARECIKELEKHKMKSPYTKQITCPTDDGGSICCECAIIDFLKEFILGKRG